MNYYNLLNTMETFRQLQAIQSLLSAENAMPFTGSVGMNNFENGTTQIPQRFNPQQMNLFKQKTFQPFPQLFLGGMSEAIPSQNVSQTQLPEPTLKRRHVEEESNSKKQKRELVAGEEGQKNETFNEIRKAKKYQHEKDRRAKITNLYEKLEGYFAVQAKATNGTRGADGYLEGNTKKRKSNRIELLRELLRSLHFSFQLPIPSTELQKEMMGYECGSLIEELLPPNQSKQHENSKDASLLKMDREKKRRDTIKTLINILGLMLGCLKFDDKLKVLQKANTFLEHNFLSMRSSQSCVVNASYTQPFSFSM